MACDDCDKRETEREVERLGKVTRNQGIALLVTLTAVVILFAALKDKGLLSYGDLLSTARDG